MFIKKLKFYTTGNERTNTVLRDVRETIVAVEKQYYTF
jgi:hypothetical protein